MSTTSKTMPRLHARALAGIVAALLAGCAATVQSPQESRPAIQVPPAAAKKIVLIVQGSDTAARSSDWEPLRGEWRTAMSAAAADAGIAFEWRDSLTSLPRGPGTAVVVKVQDYRYLSTGARYGLGAFAGNAFIEADVSYRELPSNRALGSRKISTSSTAWQGIFSAMTSKQVAAICQEIVNEVKR